MRVTTTHPRRRQPATAPLRNRHRAARLLTTLALAGAILAATTIEAHAAGPGTVVAAASSVTQVLDNIRNWVMGILAGLATVFVSIGGVRYVMAGGDPGEVEKAKSAFKSAAWGYGLAALAPLVVQVLKSIVA